MYSGYDILDDQINYCTEEIALEQFNKLMMSFDKGFGDENKRYVVVLREGDKAYSFPDNYAGACYNAEGKGKLNIYLTDDNIKPYLTVLDKEYVIFKKVDYSLNYLLETQKVISTYHKELFIKENSIIQKNNNIEIYVKEGHVKDFYTLIERFGIDANLVTVKEYKNDNSLIDDIEDDTLHSDFIRGDVASTNAIHTAVAGKRISCTGNGYQSVGFNAYHYISQEYGVVTAAHGFLNVQPYQTISIGTVINVVGNTYSYYVDGSNCDAAFVPFSNQDNWASTRLFMGGNTSGFINSSNAVTSSLENTTVYKYGATTGEKSGIITSAYSDLEFSDTGYYITDMFKANNYNDNGDSGGPVGIRTGSTNPHYLSILGITTGMEYAYHNTYATKMSNVINRLHVVLY